MGSQAEFSAEQLKKVVDALTSPDWRVLWALRQSQQDLLPGVFDKLGENFLMMTWAPQLEILSSLRTVAFMTHCGWGACVEAFATATPTIGFPMFADQPINSLMMEMFGCGRSVGHPKMNMLDPDAGKVMNERMTHMMKQRAGSEPPLRDIFTTDMLKAVVGDVVLDRSYKMASNGMKHYAKANGGASLAVDCVEKYCSSKIVRTWMALTSGAKA